MMLFAGIIVCCVAAAIALFIWPMRHPPAATLSRAMLNQAFYRARLQELDHEAAQGVATDVSALQQEWRQTLSGTQAAAEAPQLAPLSRQAVVAGSALLIVLPLLFYWRVGALEQVRQWRAVQAQLPALRAQIADNNGEPLSRETLMRFGLAIRSELQRDPHNLNDWIVLGQLGKVMDNGALARDAFERAWRLAPDNVTAKTGYAEMLMRSADPADNQRAATLLRELAQRHHDRPEVLSLLAFRAYAQGDYAQAIAAWQMMLKLLPAQDPRAAVIRQSIKQAQTRLNAAAPTPSP